MSSHPPKINKMKRISKKRTTSPNPLSQSNNKMKRISKKPTTCPNPLFEKWLQEWKDEAAAKGSDRQYCFAKALQSLRKYPLLLKTGKECSILQNIGVKLSVMLDFKMSEYRKTHPEESGSLSSAINEAVPNKIPSKARTRKRKSDVPRSNDISINSTSKTETRRRVSNPDIPSNTATNSGIVTKKRPYIPAYRSGPYAILLTLYNEAKKTEYPGHMSKQQLQRLAQPLCETSLTKPMPGSRYTAWSSMAGIIKKGLVARSGCPAKFSLTGDGEEIAKHLESTQQRENEDEVELTTDFGNSLPCSQNSTSSSLLSNPISRNFMATSPNKQLPSTSTTKKTKKKTATSPIKQKLNDVISSQREDTASDNEINIIFSPGEFEVILLVDTQETAGVLKKADDATIAELTLCKIKFEVRHLKVGDFAWICRNTSSGHELTLPYIIERKRMDDLSKSIKDGRFHEQKFRLKLSGIQNLIYLVESHGNDQRMGLPLSTLQQASVNTQVVNGFMVKHTKSHRQSMAYLAKLTSLLSNTYQKKTLVSCKKSDLPSCSIHDDLVSLMNFTEFNKSSSKVKNSKVSDMFVKQLVQLRGLSVEKALAIVERYPTPQALIHAYQEGGDEKLLAKIPHGPLNRQLGIVISKTVHQLYTSPTLT